MSHSTWILVSREPDIAGFEPPSDVDEAGAVFRGEEQMLSALVLQEDYDAVIFVDRTTRARPLR